MTKKRKINIFIKENKNILLFLIINLIILFISLVVSIFVYKNEGINILFESIVELIYLLITVLFTLQFVVKQIYVNRFSGKIIYKHFDFKIMYKILFIVLMIVLYYCNLNKFINCFLMISITSSVIYFFVCFFIDMKRIDLVDYINNETKGIIEDINKNKHSYNLHKLETIYRDCLEKNEINLALQIINKYEKLFLENMCIVSQKSIKEGADLKEENSFREEILLSLCRMLTNESSTLYRRVDESIFNLMFSLLIKCYKNCTDAKFFDFMEFIIRLNISEKSKNISNLFFRKIVFIFLDEIDNREIYLRKLSFISLVYIDLIRRNILDDDFILLDNLLITLNKENSKQIILEQEIFSQYSKYIIKFSVNSVKTQVLLAELKVLEEKIENNEDYMLIIELYKKMIRYYNFIKKENDIFLWIDFFIELLNNNRESFKEEYYKIIIYIFNRCIKNYEIFDSHIFSWLNAYSIEKYKKDICGLLYNAIKYDKDFYLYSILDKINDILSETTIQQLNTQKMLLEIYDNVFLFAESKGDEKIVSFIVDSYKEMIIKLDKNNCISKSLLKYIVEQIRGYAKMYISKKGKYIDILLSIYETKVSGDRKYVLASNHSEIMDICKIYYELAFDTSERNIDKPIEYISNMLGWKVIYFIQEGNLINAKKVFSFGNDILKMLIKIDYNNIIINFVSTFVITVCSYCFADDMKSYIGDDLIKKIEKQQIKYIDNAIALRDPIKNTWSKDLNCDFAKGLNEFKIKIRKIDESQE